LSVSAARAVPLPMDASPDAIVDWALATADLVAFQAAMRRISPEMWPDVRARLARELVESNAAPLDGSTGNVAERAARGRMAARFHKIQLVKAQDVARRPPTRPRVPASVETAG
jgi:hypothetical protein